MRKPDIRRPEDVTGEWLSAVLSGAGIDAKVKSFRARKVGTGQIGDSVRFEIDYARAPAQAPASLVGKFPAAAPESRNAGVSLGNYAREVRFYQHLAATALIRTPMVYYCDVDDATSDFVLMMEDLAPAVQGDQLKGVTLNEAGLVMDEAAKLHASHWNDLALDELAWINGTKDAPQHVTPEIIAGLWQGFRGRYGARVSPEAARIGDAFCAGFTRLHSRTGPRCLTHNDFRPDNMMFASAQGGHPVTTLDWQSLGFGSGGTDVAYFLAGAISPESRREHEAAFLRRYLDKLHALGVTGYDMGDLRRDYAAGSFQLFLTAFFAAMVVTQTPRGDDMFFQMLGSAVEQILDVGALDLLG